MQAYATIVAAQLCALCAVADASSRIPALAATSQNRWLKQEIEVTERGIHELVLLAEAQGILLSATANVSGAPKLRILEEAVTEPDPAELGDTKHEEDGQKEGAEEGEEEGEEDEESRACPEEHVEWCAWDMDTSIMLLGMISFVMILFYLTNWPDDDIRLYSWQITSATISIFCAVLLFQGFNMQMRHWAKESGIREGTDYFQEKMTILQFLHCFVYLACIHFGTGIASGAICNPSGSERNINSVVWVYNDALRCNNNTEVSEEDQKKIRAVKRAMDAGKDCTATSSVFIDPDDGDEIPVTKKPHAFMQRQRKTKALGMLFAHMAGFAAICSGSSMQQLEFFANKDYKILAWLPVICNQLVLRLAFYCSDKLREAQLARLKPTGDLGPEEARKAEQGIKTIRHLMQEEVEESENDVSSLSMSYLTVNVIRFTITGCLPNEEGEEGESFKAELWHVVALYLVGFLAVGFAVGQAIMMAKYQHVIHQKKILARFLEALLNATGMCFAWCLLWATKWICKDKLFDGHEIMGRVSLAFVLTSFTAVSVFLVDKIADSMRTSFDSDKETLLFVEEIIRIIINSLGILVGFSWEHSFDGSVMGVSHMTPQPALTQLFLGVAVSILILPAWRDYILQKVMLIEDMMKKKRGLEEEGAKEETH